MGKELEEDLEALVRGKFLVEIAVGFLRFLEAAKLCDRHSRGRFYHSAQRFRVK
jgi:hypothetical protein